MALAPSWESVAVPELRAAHRTVPARRHVKPIPLYPPGRHRGERRSWVVALFAALVPTRGYTGRHRVTSATTAYRGRHRG